MTSFIQNRTSATEQLDPRVKLFALMLLAFQVLFIQTPQAIAGAAIVVLIATVFSPISFRSLFSKMLRVVWFVVFITLLNTFTLSGEVLFELFGFYGTVEGVTQGLLLSTRLILLLFLSFLFTQTTQTIEILDAFENMLSPSRRVLGPTMLVLGLTVNFVPMLIQSAQQLKRAQLARGADADRGFFRQIRFAFSAALPLFVSAFRTSHHLAEAMEARGYDPYAERTPLNTLSMKRTDWVVVLLLLGEVALLLLL
jgi:energy-coupling factor transport system permease protein